MKGNMTNNSRICPECQGKSLYTRTVESAGGYGPRLLAGLGSFFRQPDFRVVVCSDCGLTRFYAPAEALAKLPNARDWQSM
jgi:predicted nucleic-acid-binding Zn-ribbon protein